MSEEERLEHEELSILWACGTATKKQILRCMELDRKQENERKQRFEGLLDALAK